MSLQRHSHVKAFCHLHSFVVVSSCQWEKAYTCFRIQNSYFSCLQPSKPNASREKNSLRLGPLFSPFSGQCHLEECPPRRLFPPLLDAISYSLPISTEINHPISPLLTLLFQATQRTDPSSQPWKYEPIIDKNVGPLHLRKIEKVFSQFPCLPMYSWIISFAYWI